MNVKLLYTHILNSEGISTVKAADESYPEKYVATKVIIRFLAQILKLNNFTFNCINYLQISCAMRTAHTSKSYKHLYGKI